MLAIGTEPATRGIGLEEIGVTTNPAGFITVDSQLRTSVPGIWVAGDVTGVTIVALNAEQAEAQGYRVITTYLQLDRVPKAHVMGEILGGVLLTAEQGSGKVIGVQMLCPRAADIIQEATLAVRFSLTVADLASTVHVYPSISDGLRQAAERNAAEQGLL